MPSVAQLILIEFGKTSVSQFEALLGTPSVNNPILNQNLSNLGRFPHNEHICQSNTQRGQSCWLDMFESVP